MSQKPLKANKTITTDPLALVRKIAACSTSALSAEFRRVKEFKSYGEISSRFDPRSYTDYRVFRHDYMCVEILRKFSDRIGDDNELDLDAPAYESFITTERYMREVNDRLSLTSSNRHPHKGVGESSISEARLKILRLLGPQPSWSELSDSCSFSSGASFEKTRRDGSTAAHKFDCRNPEVTVACAPLAWRLIQESPLWKDNVQAFKLVPGNRITTVPKSRKTNRTIAIEPQMNMYVQKGIGAIIRRRLKSVNIDLDDQTVNQRLALKGSITGDLATVDLSSASDSISTALVWALLPPAWAELIMLTRSEVGIMPDGTEINYEKVSSMGNGYTFELESLLFWALTMSVTSKDDVVSVYGDDIIAPAYCIPTLQQVFDYVGFKLNMDKSFWTGQFRESCGKHYFNGYDVSPVYHKTNGETKKDEIMKLILLANNLRRWIGIDYATQYSSVHSWVVQHLPDFWAKPRIPDGVGDGALIGTLAEVLPTFGFCKRIQVGPCFHATVLVRVAEEATKQPYFGGYLETLSGHSPDPEPLDDLGRQLLNITRGKTSDLSTREFSVKSVKCKILKRNLRIWKWSDPVW